MHRRLGLAVLLAAAGFPGCQAPEGWVDPAEKQVGWTDANNDEVTVNPLELGRKFLSEKAYGRAIDQFLIVDLEQPGLDTGELYRLRGFCRLNLREYDEAREDFIQAVLHGESTEIVWFFLAQAHYRTQNWLPALNAFDKCWSKWHDNLSVWKMRLRCRRAMSDWEGLLGELMRAEERWPEEADFAKQHALLLLKFNFVYDAVPAGRRYLQKAGEVAEAYVALGEALRRNRRYAEAIEVLEAGRLRHPGNERLLLALAYSYNGAGFTRAAGHVMEEVSRLNPEVAAATCSGRCTSTSNCRIRS